MQARFQSFRWLLACAALSVVIILPLSAQTPGKKLSVEGLTNPTQSTEAIPGKRWALLVGVADYPSADGYQLQKLQAPVKDVNALATLLKDPQKGGFEADHVVTLADEQATRRSILIAFSDIAKRAAPEDMVLFYFSGHGYRPTNSDTTYLVPYDFDMGATDITCLNFDDLTKQIRKMEANKVVVILDACHSGGVTPVGVRTSESTGIVQRYLEAFEQSEGRALLLSSDESEVSWETSDYGVFTHFLLEGLNGAADTNKDGVITFTETALYVEEKVPSYTREHFPCVQNPTRRYELGQVRGDIPLVIIDVQSDSGNLADYPFQWGNWLYYVEKDFKNALEAYKLVPKDNPNYATAQRYIGYNIYGREWNRWEEGLPFLEEAYRVAPTDPKVLEDIGRAYLEVGKKEKGIELLKKANTAVARRALDELE